MSALAEYRQAQAEDLSAFAVCEDDELGEEETMGLLRSTSEHPLQNVDDEGEFGYGRVSRGYGTSPFFDQDPELQEGLGGAVTGEQDGSGFDGTDWDYTGYDEIPTSAAAPHMGRARFYRAKPVKSFYEMETRAEQVRQWYTDSLARLPMQILVEIVGRLDVNELVRLSQTCHRLFEVCNRDVFWQPIYEDRFGVVKNHFRDNYCTGYRDLYVDTVTRLCRIDSPDQVQSGYRPPQDQHVNDHVQDWSNDDDDDDDDGFEKIPFTDAINSTAQKMTVFSNPVYQAFSSSGASPQAAGDDVAVPRINAEGEYEMVDIPMEVFTGSNTMLMGALPLARPSSYSSDEDSY